MILVFENVNNLNFETKELSTKSLMSSFKKTWFFYFFIGQVYFLFIFSWEMDNFDHLTTLQFNATKF